MPRGKKQAPTVEVQPTTLPAVFDPRADRVDVIVPTLASPLQIETMNIDELTAFINSRYDHQTEVLKLAYRNTLCSVVDIGRALQRIKAQMRRGTFRKYTKEKLLIPVSSTTYYIKNAERAAQALRLNPDLKLEELSTRELEAITKLPKADPSIDHDPPTKKDRRNIANGAEPSSAADEIVECVQWVSSLKSTAKANDGKLLDGVMKLLTEAIAELEEWRKEQAVQKIRAAGEAAEQPKPPKRRYRKARDQKLADTIEASSTPTSIIEVVGDVSPEFTEKLKQRIAEEVLKAQNKKKAS